MKKFQMTEESIIYHEETYYRIQALRDIPRWNVKKGDKGGFIQNEKSLSPEGDCWIADYALVDKNSRVTKNSLVRDRAKITNGSTISGLAIIQGDSVIAESQIKGCTAEGQLLKIPVISDNVQIRNTFIQGYFEITDDVKIEKSDLKTYFESDCLILSENGVLNKVGIYGDLFTNGSVNMGEVKAYNIMLKVRHKAQLMNVVLDGSDSNKRNRVSLYRNAWLVNVYAYKCEMLKIVGNGRIMGSANDKMRIIDSEIKIGNNTTITGLTSINKSSILIIDNAMIDSVQLSKSDLRMKDYTSVQHVKIENQTIKMSDFSMLESSDYKTKKYSSELVGDMVE